MRIIATVPGSSNVEMGVKPGSLLPLHASAQGKVALAFGDPELLRRLMQQPLQALTPHTQTDPVDLAAGIRQIRQQGWAVAPNESMIGLNTIAAPVLDSLGNYVGAVAMVDSIQFIPAEPTRELIEAVKAAAARSRPISAIAPRQPARAAEPSWPRAGACGNLTSRPPVSRCCP